MLIAVGKRYDKSIRPEEMYMDIVNPRHRREHPFASVRLVGLLICLARRAGAQPSACEDTAGG